MPEVAGLVADAFAARIRLQEESQLSPLAVGMPQKFTHCCSGVPGIAFGPSRAISVPSMSNCRTVPETTLNRQ